MACPLLAMMATAATVLLMQGLPAAEAGCHFDNSSNPYPSGMAGRCLVPRDTSYVCYNDSRAQCYCNSTVLDCSGNEGRLTFVPRVRATFLCLNFSYNNLQELGPRFFLNVTSIRVVDLSNNDKYLRTIHPGAFRRLSNLTYLMLNGDWSVTANYSRLDPVFAVSTLAGLEMINGKLGPLPQDLFVRHPMPRLRSLYLHQNRLKHINMSTLATLPHLEEFGASENSLSLQIHSTRPLKRLRRLNIQHNGIRYFPKTCYYRHTLFPVLRHLNLRYNRIRTLLGKVCLPSLTFLDLSQNDIMTFKSGMFSATSFPRLEQLQLIQMSERINIIEAGAFSNPRLRTLSFLYNSLYLDGPRISEDSFRNCTGLEYLVLGHNFISSGKFTLMFGHLRKLRYLHLGAMQLKEIRQEMFSGFPVLHTLCMYQNDLQDLPDGVLSGLSELEVLEVNSNALSTVRPAALPPTLLSRPYRHLDLSNNPFRCDCDILWFRSLLLSHEDLFNGSWANYTCQWGQGTGQYRTEPLAELNIVTQTCLLPRLASRLIIGTSLFLLVAGLLFAFLFRYRWHIRLLLHEMCGAHKGRAEEQGRHFDYDVFVCYADEDLPWVRFHLLPKLEGQWRLKVCLHQRDFVPGWYIVDNIMNSLLKSRKILMVFSASFTRSDWCQFELSLCLSHMLRRDDTLVVVCLPCMYRHQLTLSMTAVFHTMTCQHWPGADSEAPASFWSRLRLGLRKVMPMSLSLPAAESESEGGSG